MDQTTRTMDQGEQESKEKTSSVQRKPFSAKSKESGPYVYFS